MKKSLIAKLRRVIRSSIVSAFLSRVQPFWVDRSGNVSVNGAQAK